MRTLQRRFALIRRYVLGVLLVVPLFFAQGTQPQAAVVQFPSMTGLATGILDLSVGTDSFHIDFVTGSYNAVFPTDAVFSNALSIFDEGIELIVVGSFESGRPLIAFDHYSLSFALPFAVVPTDVRLVAGFCRLVFSNSTCSIPWDLRFQFFPDGPSGSAVVISPVPLPAALPLFGSALAMLGIVGWRRKRRAAA